MPRSTSSVPQMGLSPKFLHFASQRLRLPNSANARPGGFCRYAEVRYFRGFINQLSKPAVRLCQIQFLSTVIFRPDRNNAVSPKPSVSQGEQSLFQFFRK